MTRDVKSDNEKQDQRKEDFMMNSDEVASRAHKIDHTLRR